MSSPSRPAGPVPAQDAPPSAGPAMPPQLSQDLARAGELLEAGDRIGARRIVRRVLDRAAPALLGQLADLAADLGLAEQDLATAAGRRQDVLWRRPPGGSAVWCARCPVRGSTCRRSGPGSTWPQPRAQCRGCDRADVVAS